MPRGSGPKKSIPARRVATSIAMAPLASLKARSARVPSTVVSAAPDQWRSSKGSPESDFPDSDSRSHVKEFSRVPRYKPAARVSHEYDALNVKPNDEIGKFAGVLSYGQPGVVFISETSQGVRSRSAAARGRRRPIVREQRSRRCRVPPTHFAEIEAQSRCGWVHETPNSFVAASR